MIDKGLEPVGFGYFGAKSDRLLAYRNPLFFNRACFELQHTILMALGDHIL